LEKVESAKERLGAVWSALLLLLKVETSAEDELRGGIRLGISCRLISRRKTLCLSSAYSSGYGDGRNDERSMSTEELC
jgi:hypothetical protein